jgi:hypothetical protein
MKYLKIVLAVIFVGFAAVIYFNFYGYIHSRKVDGVIVDVKRVDVNVSIMQQTGTDNNANAKLNSQLFSFAVAIKDGSGEIVTATSEDRQWAVAKPGQCAVARFYPYPPWNLDKDGTYHNARLDRLSECPVK